MNNLDNKTVAELNEKLGTISNRMGNLWLSFGKGLLTGFGSVLGAGLAIILIGWFLNVIGVIPAFQRTAEQWRQVFIENQNQGTFVPTEIPTENIQE